jgi:hypothetical protein
LLSEVMLYRVVGKTDEGDGVNGIGDTSNVWGLGVCVNFGSERGQRAKRALRRKWRLT